MSIRAFSFGGGVQSTAALVLAAERKIDFPLFIFANTGDDSENPATIDYIERFSKPYAETHGIEFVVVAKTRKGTVETLYENLVGNNRTIAIPVRMANGAPGNRKCTRDWKIRPVAKELRRRGAKKKNPAVIGIGISRDEWHRAKDSMVPYVVHEHPLLDLDYTRADCGGIIRLAGLPVPPKSSCWFCPYKTKREWSEMAAKDPATFAKACELETKLETKRGTFGKDKVYMTDGLRPLSEAVLPNAQLKLNLGDDEECTGYCWT